MLRNVGYLICILETPKHHLPWMSCVDATPSSLLRRQNVSCMPNVCETDDSDGRERMCLLPTWYSQGRNTEAQIWHNMRGKVRYGISTFISKKFPSCCTQALCMRALSAEESSVCSSPLHFIIYPFSLCRPTAPIGKQQEQILGVQFIVWPTLTFSQLGKICVDILYLCKKISRYGRTQFEY